MGTIILQLRLSFDSGLENWTKLLRHEDRGHVDELIASHKYYYFLHVDITRFNDRELALERSAPTM